MFKTAKKKGFTIKAYKGDAKTLLAFNLDKPASKNFAGFTIEVKPPSKKSYFLLNTLRFPNASKHAQDSRQLSNASVNAPFQKFRWLHVPGINHQLNGVEFGDYTYTVTPRYFENGAMKKLDATLSLSITINVSPFTKKKASVAFTRGFTQSQAFARHFGTKLSFSPKNGPLLFDTSQVAGTATNGKKFSYADVYDWAGFTARDAVFAIANEVKKDKSLSLDAFAYDFNEPDLLSIFLQLAKEGRMRLILDDAPLHHDKSGKLNEDQFEKLFTSAATGNAAIKRGHYARFAHDKIFIVKKAGKPVKVLTGSTNFSVTGIYVNANHVLVFTDAKVAQQYEDVFNESWNNNVSVKFADSPLASTPFSFSSRNAPSMSITFSPHKKDFGTNNLNTITARIEDKKTSSVFFAVMALTGGGGTVLKALQSLHSSQTVFSFGISDSPGGISLYKPGNRKGVLVTGKPTASKLPPPFNQEKSVGLGHEIHHKFIVCNFNDVNPVVWCGSSNLAEGGEAANGDNLLCIQDADIATVFAIEALALTDHFHFRNKTGEKGGKKPSKPYVLSLHEDDTWATSYFTIGDYHFDDRELFK